MTYSTKLDRHIRVDIEYLNKFHDAELDAAISAMGADASPEDIRKAAKQGNLNAKLIIEQAAQGNQLAKDWL